MIDLTISQAHKGLKEKKFSAVELYSAYLDRIKKENKKNFAFLTVSEESTLFQAKKVDDLISKNKKISLLTGIPAAIKDNILVENLRCTAGSKILENYIAPYSATVIRKLEKQGVIILGKTNLDEFAMGSSGENSAFGPTKNPLDLSRVPGGSSSGSAAVVAANMSIFALGSDTGGSVRLPASFCGVVGLKPTYGAVSRYGLIAFASSLDQIGPIAKTVEDCQIVFDAIKGKDEMDSTSVNSKFKIQKSKPQLKTQNLKDIKIGIPKEYFIKGINPEVEKIIKNAIKKYEDMGAKIKEVSLPHTKYALPCYYIIASSEASANLARYDGVRYGLSKGFGAEVKRRIMLGTYILSAGHYEDYYLKAQKIRNLIKQDFEKVFKQVDALITPVSPFLPFKIGEKIDDPLSMYLVDVYTTSVNLAGLPALSLPIGNVGKLPVGLQIIGKWFEEDKIFEIGKKYEHTRANNK
jgi:aspartyl-tRNA(Asn)/glutamyl-tRNA(Gln) amidotransferase subunit A